MSGLNRRNFVTAAGAAGAATAFGGTANAFETVAEGLDTDGGMQEAIVVFRRNEEQSVLDDLDLVGRFDYQVLPMSWVELDGEQLSALAERDEVRHVSDTFELEFYNDVESREAMHVETVNDAVDFTNDEITGEGVDAVVIDSGIDGSHPDFQGRIESNYQYVDEPLGDRDPELWLDIGPGDSDDVGHGQHCCGILAGDGNASKTEGTGPYVGMAPEARLSAYSTTQGIYLPYAVGAWDHMIARKRDPDVDFDPVVCSNSYGVARGNRFNPLDPLNVASWEAFQSGILPVFAAGNDGPGQGTISRYAKAPHVLGVAAGTKEKSVTGFSSRGRNVGDELPDGSDLQNTVYHDRETLFSNLQDFHMATKGRLLANFGTLSGEFSAAGGSTHSLRVPNNADLLEGTLDIQPDGQQVVLSFYTDYGTDDEELLARMGEEPTDIHQSIGLDVPGGEVVTVAVEPGTTTAAGQYSFEYKLFETSGVSEDLDDLRPLTLYRPGITTHGNSVMSTFDPEDALAPLSTGDGEPFYGRISGTSMACPAAAGVAVLVCQAARDNGHDPSPMDVLLTIEAAAGDVNDDYTPASAGPGWIDAKAAVDRAKEGNFGTFEEVSTVDSSVPPADPSLSAFGGRQDDGAVFTQGQTNQVEITLDSASLNDSEASISTVTVEDTVPSGWKVLEGFGDDPSTTTNDDSITTVTFDGVPTGGDALTYFVKAEGGSGSYTFGPAVARTNAIDEEGRSTSQIAGTDTNYIVGQNSNF